MSEQKSRAYRAGQTYARMKNKFDQARSDEPTDSLVTPTVFAVGGVLGFFTFYLLGIASSLLAGTALAVLMGALAWELMFKKPK